MPTRLARHLVRSVACAGWIVAGAALATAPTLATAEGLEPVADALIAAYAGPAPLPADATVADLILEKGRVEWDQLDAVTVVPDAVLRIVRTGDAADAFADFARSPDGQQALIDAGHLPDSVELVDQAGRTVRVPQPVRRIASPYSLATYHVYVTGAADRLVSAGYLGARDPAGAAAMTRIDPRFPEIRDAAPADTTSVEYLASLRPDLVLTSARSEWVPSVQGLGIPVLTFEGETTASLRQAIVLAGRALGPDAAARAHAWTDYDDAVLARVEAARAAAKSAAESAAGSGAPRVLFTGTDRGQVASGAMYQTAWIEAAGGVSVSAELSGYWNDVGIEQVLTWDPDLVLVPPYGRASVDAIVDDPTWQLLDAVQAGRVVRVPKLVAPWDTPVPDAALGVVWLAGVLWPDSAVGSCADEARFFYRRFYDVTLSDAEAGALCGP